MPVNSDEMAPTFGEIDILLSFKTIIKLLWFSAALLSASSASPPVSAPSPIMDTT